MTAYFATCSCGRSVEVPLSKAGAAIDCSCGQTIQVPRMSDLRKSAGERAYESSIVDVIERKIDEGQLPSSTTCATTGMHTEDRFWIDVVCEQPWFRNTNSWGWAAAQVILTTVLTLGNFIFWFTRESQTEIRGRFRSVRLPIRADESCHEQLSRMSRRRQRVLLLQEPEYAQLFKEYPKAKVI